MATLGRESYEFVDFLAEARQSFWQILPIGPVGKTLSPYQSSSAFAGNPSLIDKNAIDRDPVRYAPKGSPYTKFLTENASWINNYALFEALHVSQKRTPLPLWPDELRNPSAKALRDLRIRYKAEAEAVLHEQYCFYVQWRELKRYANLKGVRIIGDLPIYVYEDSAEFWLRRNIFDVDKDGRPASSAGVPPDAFSKTGQVWNNPVYEWEKSGKEVFDFWRDRLAQAARLYDGFRIDHFRAFADYYAIPTDKNGEWRTGPGKAFTDMVKKEFPGLFIIAEDLGDLSYAAKTLVTESGFPGMKVMQFAFCSDSKNPYLPHNIQENAACFTGTHDNNTLAGWLRSVSGKERRFAMEYLGVSHPEDLHGAILAAALASKADTTIIPLQDWLGLGAEARLNKPGTAGGRNWKWKAPKEALTHKLAFRIRHATKDLYNR